MKGIVLRVAATAIAFVILIYLLPDNLIDFDGSYFQLALLAIGVGVVNAFIKPVVKILSFPISMLTLGLFGFVVNAALILAIAWVAQGWAKIDLTIGGFPTTGITADTLVAAVVVSVALSAVSVGVGLVVHD